MKRGLSHLALVLVLVGGLVVPVPLAYAVPADLYGTQGFYNDDDAIFTVASSEAALDPFPLFTSSPFVYPTAVLPPEGPVAVQSHCGSSAEARAPPLS